ncbi:MAK10-like protein [Tanacetum coccineum]
MKILSVLLKITPNLATRAIGTSLSSPKGTMWCLFDLTPSASNWLERLPAGSISTWEDFTTRFLAQFFPPGRTAKLRNDILISLLKPLPANINELPKENPFTFHEYTGPNPQPQALGITFEARVRDYMAAYTKRMDSFENAIFKQQEKINDRMTEMFGLLKELTTSRAPEKVLIREETKHFVTKNVNSISLIRGEEEMNADDNATSGDSIERPDGSDTEVQLNEVDKENEAKNGTENEPIKNAEKKPTQVEEEESLETPSSQPVGYYLKHRINEKLIEGLVENHRFNDSLSAAE